MKRIIISSIGCLSVLFCSAQIVKPAVKTNATGKPSVVSQKNTAVVSSKSISKPVVQQTSYPSSWLKSGMNANWVIPAGNWLASDFTGFLLSDKTSYPYLYLHRNIPIQSLVLYPLQVEDAMDVRYRGAGICPCIFFPFV